MLKEKLKELREHTGLKQVDFARKVGCTTQHINNQEQGRSAVSFKTIEKYAKVFGFRVDLKLRIIK